MPKQGWEKEGVYYYYFFFGLIMGLTQSRHRAQPHRISFSLSQGRHLGSALYVGSICGRKRLQTTEHPAVFASPDINHQSCLAVDMPTNGTDGLQGKHTPSERLSSFP